MEVLGSHCQIHENYEFISKCLLCNSVYCEKCCDELYDNNIKCSKDVLGTCLLSDYVPPIIIPVKKLIFINPFYDYLLKQLVIHYNRIQECLKLLFIGLNYPKDILKYILMLYMKLYESKFVCICDHLDDCLSNIKKRIKRICCEKCSSIRCLQDGKICIHCHFTRCIKCHMIICLSCRRLQIISKDCFILKNYDIHEMMRCHNSQFLD